MTENPETLTMSGIWLNDVLNPTPVKSRQPFWTRNNQLYPDRTPILDMTAGSRMFWWDKENKNVVFADKRYEEYDLGTYQTKDGEKPRKCIVHPDIVADFRHLPFADQTYHMVVFDPPHLLRAGKDSWLRKKYSVLDSDTWQDDINMGFHEAMRVLKPYGTLIFKWNDDQINLSEVLKHIDYKPLFGDKKSKTHWLVFMKLEDAA